MSSTDLLLTSQQITLECKNLYYKPKSIKKEILRDVSGRFMSGRLTAILGPSGAGKTSFLNVMSGFKDNGIRGSILVNGIERKLSDFRKISSYIPQQFAMLGKLTVLETLQTSADLKLGLKTHRSIKQKVIDEIIKLLNLEKCRNTLVERLSGGEKKRLSIGMELVTNPPIMFFDEPTSGLDSVSSLQVLMHLQKLAQSGRTIVCVIHQPSSRLLNLFDDVLVLSDGQSIYCGSQKDMVKHFQSESFTCPNYYNPADYVIEVASKEHGSDLSSLVTSNKLKFCDDTDATDVAVKSDENSTILNGFSKSRRSYKEKDELETAYPATFTEQFSILTRRSMRAMIRERLAVQTRLMVHVAIAVLLGTVFWDVGNDATRILSNVSCLFFIIMFIFFGNSMPVLLSCPLETEVFLREHLNNWYSIRAYYLSKLFSDFPLQFACPTVFVFTIYYMTGQPYDCGRFLMFWAICLLTGSIGQSWGLLFGSTFGLDMSVFLVPASSIPMMVFSGFFIRFNELSVYMRPMTYISFFRYAFEGSVQAIFGYNRPDLDCFAPFCYYKSVSKLLSDMSMSEDMFKYDVAVLTGCIVFINILFYISLSVKVRMSQ